MSEEFSPCGCRNNIPIFLLAISQGLCSFPEVKSSFVTWPFHFQISTDTSNMSCALNLISLSLISKYIFKIFHLRTVLDLQNYYEDSTEFTYNSSSSIINIFHQYSLSQLIKLIYYYQLNSIFNKISSVFLQCLFAVSESHLVCHITFNLLSFFLAVTVSQISMFMMTFTILRITCQVFCIMTLNWNLTDVFFS